MKSIAILNDQLWVATQTALLQLDTSGKLLKKYSILEGFPTRLDLCQDDQGHIWVKSGLYFLREWDGKQWIDHDADVKNKTIVFQPTLRQIWLDDRKGIQLRKAGQWQYTALPTEIAESKNSIYVSGAFQDDKGRIWLETNFKDTYLLEQGRWTKHEGIRDVLQDISGQIWCYNSKKDDDACYLQNNEWISSEVAFTKKMNGTLYFDKKQQKTYTIYSGAFVFDGTTWEKMSPPFDRCLSLAQDAQGNLWLGSDDAQICRWDGTNYRCFRIENPTPLAASLEKEAIINCADGGLLLPGEETKSPALWHKNGQWTVFRDSTLFGEYDTWFAVDYAFKKDDCHWFVTNRALLQYQNGKWTNLLKLEGIKYAYLDSLKQLCMLTYQAEIIEITAQGDITVFPLKNADEDKMPDVIYGAGALWLADSENNIKRCTGDTCVDIRKEGTNIYHIEADAMGRVWVVWKKIIQLFDKNQNLEFTKPEYGNTFVSDTKGNTWMESMNTIWVWSGKSWKKWGKQSNVSMLFVDSKNRLWISDRREIRCYDADSKRLLASWKDPLYIERAVSFLEDEEGNVWLNTYNGLLRFSELGGL